MLFVITENIS